MSKVRNRANSRAATGGSGMRKCKGIRQNALPNALPDFRNLGVMSRVLLLANALALLFLRRVPGNSRTSPGIYRDCRTTGARASAVVIVLYAGSPLLARLEYRSGVLAVGPWCRGHPAFFPFQGCSGGRGLA